MPSSTTTSVPVEELGPLLVELRAAGFIDFEPAAGNPRELADLPGAGSRFLMVGGTGGDYATGFVGEMLVAMLPAEGAIPVVVAEVLPAEADSIAERTFVSDLREIDALTGRVSTVDNVQARRLYGTVATVLALADLDEGRVGAYGSADGAQRLLPAAPG